MKPPSQPDTTQPQPPEPPTVQEYLFRKQEPTNLRSLFWGIFFLFMGCLAYIAYDAHKFLYSPASSTPNEIVFTIEPGATFDRVAWDLKKAGAITDVWRFRLLGKVQKSLGSVKAGDYLINTGWNPQQVLYQITKGQALLYKLTLREGLTWWETAKAIEAQGFAKFEDFKEVIHDPVFLQKHNIPFKNAEGFLYPETYLLKKPRQLDRNQAEEIASMLVSTFWKRTQPIWQELPAKRGYGIPIPKANATNAAAVVQNATVQITAIATTEPLPANQEHATTESADARTVPEENAQPQEQESIGSSGPLPGGPRLMQPDEPSHVQTKALAHLIILASLVEKETGVAEERARVAGVYTNRLALNMLLQCDPTIIYGIGESFSGAIKRSQLQDSNNPYNTYQHAGLPPGPICSPGYHSLVAAHKPEVHKYIYFVATGKNGEHTFSTNLADHNKAVKAYRETQNR